MALKRPRAAFEADLQRVQSPYVFFGTPLPALDDNVRDDGSYVPVWKQEVVDERGRKRLHGAFTGGFSAGYFNTVGSKDGWTPATFVSSRTNRAKPQEQRTEDYMDEEDLADAEEARQLETQDKFSGFGSTEQEIGKNGRFMDLFRPSDETMGMKLLRRMGWKDGQGIGPQVKLRRAKTKTHEPDDPGGGKEEEETYMAPPENTKLISFIRKTDTKGLAYEGDDGLGPSSENAKEVETRVVVKKPIVKPRKGGIGIGVLNDTGSDDEDPYDMGPKLSYGRLGGDKKKKKKQVDTAKTASNPGFASKKVPTFTSSKITGFRKCHDGRLPLDGFVLSTRGPMSDDRKFPAPTIPEGWVSSRQKKEGTIGTPEYQSTADLAKASTLNPSSRASMLGETVLPGKSVFDFLTPSARDKLVSASNNTHLPPARSEAPLLRPKPEAVSFESQIPPLDPQVALNALNRGGSGFVPYSDDPAKLTRYRVFLSYRSRPEQSATSPAPACPPEMKRDDFLNELHEFAHAATIFKPMTGAMASRFTSSSTTAGAGTGSAQDEEERENERRRNGLTGDKTSAASIPLKPEEEAAKNGMYGPLTRSIEPFFPSRLLCKRLGIPPPVHVMPEGMENDPGNKENATRPPASAAAAEADAFLASLGTRFASGGIQIEGGPQDGNGSRKLEILGKRDMDALRRAAGLPELGEVVRRKDREVHAVDPARNEALEAERPSEETFRSIFADDDNE